VSADPTCHDQRMNNENGNVAETGDVRWIPGTMEPVFELLDEGFGGSAAWLSAHGLSDADLERPRRRMAPGEQPGRIAIRIGQ
jgi:hypothetical protein